MTMKVISFKLVGIGSYLPLTFFSSSCDFTFHHCPAGLPLLLGELVEIGMNPFSTE